MPLYEYECAACGRRFELIQRFSDPPVEICPGCGGAVRKLLSTPAIQFKGTGWYITDYARKGKAPKAEPARSDAGKPGGDATSSPSSDTTTSGPPAGTPAGSSTKSS